MRVLKQDHLPGFGGLGTKEFGGSKLRGNAREQRPIAVKRAMHLVLKSSIATGERSFLRKNRVRQIEALVFRLGRESGVRVYRFANSGNHLHILLRARSRQAFQRYLRALSGLIARMVLGAERGHGVGLNSGTRVRLPVLSSGGAILRILDSIFFKILWRRRALCLINRADFRRWQQNKGSHRIPLE